MCCIHIDLFQYYSRNDVLVSCTVCEFIRKGKVSKYEKKLQDLMKGLKGLKGFNWAVTILSHSDYSATIAQVLLSLNSLFDVVALLVNMNKSLL